MTTVRLPDCRPERAFCLSSRGDGGRHRQEPLACHGHRSRHGLFDLCQQRERQAHEREGAAAPPRLSGCGVDRQLEHFAFNGAYGLCRVHAGDVKVIAAIPQRVPGSPRGEGQGRCRPCGWTDGSFTSVAMLAAAAPAPSATQLAEAPYRALLHEAADGRGCPIPGRTDPTASVRGMPRAVSPFRTAIRTGSSAPCRSKARAVSRWPGTFTQCIFVSTRLRRSAMPNSTCIVRHVRIAGSL